MTNMTAVPSDKLKEMQQTMAEQAAVIEALQAASLEVVGPFVHAEQGSPIQNLRKLLASPTDSKQVLAEWLDKVLGEPVGGVDRADSVFNAQLKELLECCHRVVEAGGGGCLKSLAGPVLGLLTPDAGEVSLFESWPALQ